MYVIRRLYLSRLRKSTLRKKIIVVCEVVYYVLLKYVDRNLILLFCNSVQSVYCTVTLMKQEHTVTDFVPYHHFYRVICAESERLKFNTPLSRSLEDA